MVVSTTSPAAATWSDLLPDLLGRVIALLPFPADRARFRAVCRAWHSAARAHVRQPQLPWIVLPDCSFCTIDGGAHFLLHIGGENSKATTCLGAAADGWLALDCTDDVFRRTPHWDDHFDYVFAMPRPDVKHSHTYLLHNPFSGETVPLPELDSIVGNVAETFEIRKVLMRSSSPDDMVAVTTNNWNYNVILCRPGKGMWVVHNLRVFDVAFLGDRLYGITPDEDLIALDLAEEQDGRPIVTRCRRVIKSPVVADDAEDSWSWMYDDDTGSDDDDDDGQLLSASSDEDEQGLSDEDDKDGDLQENNIGHNNGNSDSDEEQGSSGEEDSSFNGDDSVPGGTTTKEDEESLCEPKDYISTTRYLIRSHGTKELLLVKHHLQLPSYSSRYTRKVQIFKADISAGKWVPVSSAALAQGEALFLSRAFCKCTHADGDIKESLIYFINTDEVFDVACWACKAILPSRTHRTGGPRFADLALPSPTRGLKHSK